MPARGLSRGTGRLEADRSMNPTDRAGRGRPAKDASAVKLRLFRHRRPQLTGRGMVITAMALFLVVVLASPLQTYLNRRDAVSASERQQQQLKQHVADLQQQSNLWNDTSYIERQARARLQYVRPGDTVYTVLNPDGTPRSDGTSATSSVQRSGHLPSWNATLWSSVQDADRAK
jgi:cell division protein FtsB